MSQHCGGLAPPGSEPFPGGKGSQLGGCSRSPWLLKGSQEHLLRPPVCPSHVHIQWETPRQACTHHCPTQDPPQSSCPYFCRQVVCEAVHSAARVLLPSRLWGADQTIRPKVRVLLSPGGEPSLGPPKTGGWGAYRTPYLLFWPLLRYSLVERGERRLKGLHSRRQVQARGHQHAGGV